MAKEHQVATVVYHLVAVSINNSGRALLCAGGFACMYPSVATHIWTVD